jgi:hypothetical protein
VNLLVSFDLFKQIIYFAAPCWVAALLFIKIQWTHQESDMGHHISFFGSLGKGIWMQLTLGQGTSSQATTRRPQQVDNDMRGERRDEAR